jgi:hypothetical protein
LAIEVISSMVIGLPCLSRASLRAEDRMATSFFPPALQTVTLFAAHHQYFIIRCHHGQKFLDICVQRQSFFSSMASIRKLWVFGLANSYHLLGLGRFFLRQADTGT